MEETELRIGEVASRTGVDIDTLRYYEKRRLLGRARRSRGGFSFFAHESVERVLFIKQAQEVGFLLAEIGGLLATGGAEECRKLYTMKTNTAGSPIVRLLGPQRG